MQHGGRRCKVHLCESAYMFMWNSMCCSITHSFTHTHTHMHSHGSRTTPHEDNSPPDKNKAQPLPTRTTIPRTIPHQDNSPLGPLPRNKTTHQDKLYGGELSSWGVVRIRHSHTSELCTFHLPAVYSTQPPIQCRKGSMQRVHCAINNWLWHFSSRSRDFT